MLTAPKPESQRILITEGTHLARLYGLIHIGTIKTPFENEDGEPIMQSKINLTFEFPDDTHVWKEGEPAKPLVLSQEYTLSMSKKANLRPIVEGIIGTGLTDDEAHGFDQETLVGMPCLVTIKHKQSKKGTTFAVIASTAPLMKGQEPKAQVNPSKVLTYQKWDQAQFDALPDFIQEKMKGSAEYKAFKANSDIASIPF